MADLLSHNVNNLLLPCPPPPIQEKTKDKDKRFRPLYDIPYMFEAREFLRKKLIGKKVSRSVPGGSVCFCIRKEST